MVAIEKHFFNLQPVARGLTFFPESFARAPPKVNGLGLNRFRDRLLVHVAEHEDGRVLPVLNDSGDEPVLIELQRFVGLLAHRVMPPVLGIRIGRTRRVRANRFSPVGSYTSGSEKS